MLLVDSILHGIDIARAERETGNFLYAPGKKGTDGAKRFRCYTTKNGGKFPKNSLTEIVPKILEDTRVDNLIIQAPANDVTNMGEVLRVMRTEEIVPKVSESAKTIAYLADRVTREYPKVKKVIVVHALLANRSR